MRCPTSGSALWNFPEDLATLLLITLRRPKSLAAGAVAAHSSGVSFWPGSAGGSSNLSWSWRALRSAGERPLSAKPGTLTLPELPPCDSVEVSQKDIIIIIFKGPNDRPIDAPRGTAPNLWEHLSGPQLTPIFASCILAMSRLIDFKKIPLGLWEALHLFQHSGILKRGQFTVLSRFEFIMCKERTTPVQ